MCMCVRVCDNEYVCKRERGQCTTCWEHEAVVCALVGGYMGSNDGHNVSVKHGWVSDQTFAMQS